MKKHILAIGLLLSTMTPALALDVGDISSFMNSGSSTLSKEIKNTTDSGRGRHHRLGRPEFAQQRAMHRGNFIFTRRQTDLAGGNGTRGTARSASA